MQPPSVPSFQHKNFWMQRDADFLAEENVGYDNSSKTEAMRGGHRWFMNAGESEVFGSNKKQAVEGASGNPISGVSHVNISPRDTNSGFHSVNGQFSDRLFGSGLRAVNFVEEKNMQSIGNGNPNIGSRDFENQYSNDPSVGLSISHTVEDPSSCLNFGGIRKVKVNQVRDSDNCLSSSTRHSYARGDYSTISIGAGFSKNDGNISLGPTYNSGNDNTISMATTITKADDNLVSMGHTFNKGDGNFMLMGHNYGKGDDNALSVSQPFDRGDGNFISIGPTYDKVDSNIASTAPSYDKGDSSSLAMGHNHNKGEGSNISFGSFHDDPEPNQSGGIISGYNQLMSNQSSSQGLDGQKALAPVDSAPKSNPEKVAIIKNKEPKTTKKAPCNNFPLNVKSLLTTGIFDGVPVKYFSSRERYHTGIIKGTGYLCSCDNCKHSKALNAYEFERHAGAKSKHPNSHIYFENGKSIYAVVQELKNTPQDMLFDAIETVTGSTINQKNFRNWKASYQAATRELQRIYGKDEVILRF